jgi:arylsulfatase A-like enzyme
MAARKPNILIVWGDDIGYWNISAYNLAAPAQDHQPSSPTNAAPVNDFSQQRCASKCPVNHGV